MKVLLLELKLFAMLLVRTRRLKPCIIMWKHNRQFKQWIKRLRASNHFIKPADGEALNKLGMLYGLERFSNEDDDPYRERLLKVAQGLGMSK